MRILVFSDLHGNQYAWRAFLEQISGLSYDRAVFLGDVFGYYYGQKEILQGLFKLPGLIWLKGNHERLFQRLVSGEECLQKAVQRYGSSYRFCMEEDLWMEKAIAGLPFSCDLQVDGLNIFFCHGTPEDPAEGRIYPRDGWEPALCQAYDIVVCGHTHFRMIRQGENKLWLNAGSLGQPRDGSRSGVLLLDTAKRSYEYIDIIYDKEPLYREIAEHDPGLTKLQEILEREMP